LPFTYQVQYPAPGSPELARRVKDLLRGAGFSTTLDEKRGFDHGVFCPFAVAYPEAGIPVVQLSIRADYDPATHLAAGRALAPLRKEGVLIVGSGLTYHNLRQFNPAGGAASHAFDEWLTNALCACPYEERSARLTRWAKAPAARQCHPQEDHLIPLMVAVGAAGEEPGIRIYHEDNLLGGLAVSGYRFGDRVAL
jgi:aromatic ring-opening dioxygenase catalytic subunit (LigB family)